MYRDKDSEYSLCRKEINKNNTGEQIMKKLLLATSLALLSLPVLANAEQEFEGVFAGESHGKPCLLRITSSTVNVFYEHSQGYGIHASSSLIKEQLDKNNKTFTRLNESLERTGVYKTEVIFNEENLPISASVKVKKFIGTPYLGKTCRESEVNSLFRI